MRQAAPALLAEYGVGPDSAAALLIAAGDNPERLHSEAAFAALCGTNPIPASSGQTDRHRLNRGGNRQANAALHRIIIVRLAGHDETRAYMRGHVNRNGSNNCTPSDASNEPSPDASTHSSSTRSPTTQHSSRKPLDIYRSVGNALHSGVALGRAVTVPPGR